MSKKFGVGVIGAGAIFPSHLQAYKFLSKRFRLIGIADTDEVRLRKAGQMHFLPVSTQDYHDLLAREDIDIIDICTPPGVHGQLVKDALAAGKYVICEKPLAPTLAEVDDLIEFCRDYPGKLSTVFQRRYAADVKKLMRLKEDESLGQIVGGTFNRTARGAFVKAAKNWGSWRMSGGGTVMTQFVHELDLMCLVYGEPASVTASMDTVHLPIESEDAFAATVRFKSGAIVSCSSSTGVGKSGVMFDVVGTDRVHRYASKDDGGSASGLARIQQLAEKVVSRGGDKIKQKLGRPTKPKGDGGSHRPYFEAILSALDMDQPLPVGPESSRPAVELATGIYTSALLGQPVEFPLETSATFYRGVTAEAYAARDGKDAGKPNLTAISGRNVR
jgi:predicted dehydrogenase